MVLGPDDTEFLGIAYSAITSKYPHKDDIPITIGDALYELEEVKFGMMSMAKTMGLMGRMALIFASLLLDELVKFTWMELKCYCNIFHILLPYEMLLIEESDDVRPLAIIVFNEHIKRLQRMRLKRYAAAIFFGIPEFREGKRPQVFFFDDTNETGQLLSEEEIRDKGVDYWFPRVGGLRAESLASRFDFFEALYMLMNAGTLDPRDSGKKDVPTELRFEITNDMEDDDVYQQLAGFFFDSKEDARGYVTLDGIMFSYVGEEYEEFTPLNDVAIFDMERLHLIAKQEGLDVHVTGKLKPNAIIMFEWCISQLGDTFMSNCGEHRLIMEASLYEKTSSNQIPYYINEDEMVYFGKRDGVSKVVIHTMEELCSAFVELPDKQGVLQTYAYDPLSLVTNINNPSQWLRYPRKVVTRLLEIILKSKHRSKWGPILATKCRNILNSTAATTEGIRFQDEIFKQLKLSTTPSVKKTLIKMWNSGLALAATEEDPDEIFSDGVTQRESYNYILNVEKAILDAGSEGNMIRRLLIIENYYDLNVVHYEDHNYEIGNFLVYLREINYLGLSTMLKLGGMFLANTASYIFKKLYNSPITNITITIEEQNVLNRLNKLEYDLNED